MDLRSGLRHAVKPPSPKRRASSASRKALLEALEAAERLAKAGESSFRAANALGLHFDPRTGRRASLTYDNTAASRAGVDILNPEACFHILSYTPFTQRGVAFPTVHHYVMAERFKGSPAYDEIPYAASLWEVDRLVEIAEANGWERSDWNAVRLNTLVVGTFLKFRQNPEALKILVRTKQRTITMDLPAHYSKWIAHERVVHKKPSDLDDEAAVASSVSSRVASAASGSRSNNKPGNSAASAAAPPPRSAAAFLEQAKAVDSDGNVTIITGSTCKNLGGAVLMSLRKKLQIAHQADEKARIKKRQMEILAAQMLEKQKAEEARQAKLEAKLAAQQKAKEAEAAAAAASSSSRQRQQRGGGGGSPSSPSTTPRRGGGAASSTKLPRLPASARRGAGASSSRSVR